jgi:hypothetical protein
MPTRSVAPFIDEAIDSVFGQTYENWTLLISENGAPGGELERRLAPYLDDPRVRYQAVGADLSAAMNHTRLIGVGDAPYVGVLHDDDRWQPEFIERRVAFLEQHPECGFVFSGNDEFDADSRPTGSSDFVLAEGVYPPREILPLLVRRNVIGMPTLLVRRSAYEAIGAAFDEETVFFDYLMWLRLAARFPVGYLAVRDAVYRVHDTQITMTPTRRGVQQLRLFEQIEELLASVPEIEVDRRWLRRRVAGAHLSAALDDVQEAKRSAAAAHLRDALKTYPAVAVDPRTPAVLLGLGLGRRGRHALERARWQVLRRRLRLHVRR